MRALRFFARFVFGGVHAVQGRALQDLRRAMKEQRAADGTAAGDAHRKESTWED